eukprot:scaffold87655_cov35-Tisochrysis_lutea.AAC.4
MLIDYVEEVRSRRLMGRPLGIGGGIHCVIMVVVGPTGGVMYYKLWQIWCSNGSLIVVVVGVRCSLLRCIFWASFRSRLCWWAAAQGWLQARPLEAVCINRPVWCVCVWALAFGAVHGKAASARILFRVAKL